jgi:Mrp family chromosome partitioning ATPase
VVVTGKGGVGKSVLSATLARILASDGRRVLLLDSDPRENCYQLLGSPPSDREIVEAGPGLYLQNLRPTEVLGELVRERLHVEFLARRVLASTVYQQFVAGAPGFKELATLGHALRVLKGLAGRKVPAVDTVLLDAPATGHGLALLLAPGLVSEVIPHGPFGEMAAELAGFVGDAERCGVVVVTTAEEMPVQETADLLRELRGRLDRGPELLIVNGLYPPLPRDADGAREPAAIVWRERRRVNERELGRLGELWRGTRVELPLLPIDRGPDLVAALQELLAEALSAPPEKPCD